MENAFADVVLPDHTLFKKGKVRNVYEIGDKLLIVATDRISAFDHRPALAHSLQGQGPDPALGLLVRLHRARLPQPPHHRRRRDKFPPALAKHRDDPRQAVDARQEDPGRSHRVRRPRLPLRLGLEGIQGLGQGLRHQASRRAPANPTSCDEPIFTPSTKAETGTTRTSPSRRCRRSSAPRLAKKIKKTSLELYQKASLHALSKGIIIADTKFEFGLDGRRPHPDRRDLHPRLLALLAPGRPTTRARASRAWTSSSSAITSRARRGTRSPIRPALPAGHHRQDLREIPRDLQAPDAARPSSEDRRMSGFVDLHIHSRLFERRRFLARGARPDGPRNRLRRHLHRRPRHGRRLSGGHRGGRGLRGRGRSRAWRSRRSSTAANSMSSCRSWTGRAGSSRRSPAA